MSGDIEKSDGGHIPVVGVPTNDVEPSGEISRTVGYLQLKGEILVLDHSMIYIPGFFAMPITSTSSRYKDLTMSFTVSLYFLKCGVCI